MSDAATFEECFQARKVLFQENEDLLQISLDQILSRGKGWTNESMTDATIAVYNELCSALDAHFSLTQETIVQCESENVTHKAYRNVGECLPSVDSCAAFTLGTFVVRLTNRAYKNMQECHLISEIIEDDIPSLPPSKEATPDTTPSPPPFVSIPYADTRRAACEEAQRSFAEENPSYSTFLSQYLDHQESVDSRKWENTTSTQADAAVLKDRCRSTAGTPTVFTGILECYGTGSFNQGTLIHKAYRNQVECFPSEKSCDYYTLQSSSQWHIDENHVADLSCREVSSPAFSTPLTDIESTKGRRSALIPIVIMLTITWVIYVVKRRRRRKRLLRRLCTPVEVIDFEMSAYTDGDAEADSSTSERDTAAMQSEGHVPPYPTVHVMG